MNVNTHSDSPIAPTADIQAAIAAEAARFLRRWQLGVAPGGTLWIAPTGAPLRLVELGVLASRLRAHCRDGFPRRLVIDLRGVRIIGASREQVQSALEQFGREIGVACAFVP